MLGSLTVINLQLSCLRNVSSFSKGYTATKSEVLGIVYSSLAMHRIGPDRGKVWCVSLDCSPTIVLQTCSRGGGGGVGFEGFT